MSDDTRKRGTGGPDFDGSDRDALSTNDEISEDAG